MKKINFIVTKVKDLHPNSTLKRSKSEGNKNSQIYDDKLKDNQEINELNIKKEDGIH